MSWTEKPLPKVKKPKKLKLSQKIRAAKERFAANARKDAAYRDSKKAKLHRWPPTV